jgi:hypothetical protein
MFIYGQLGKMGDEAVVLSRLLPELTEENRSYNN